MKKTLTRVQLLAWLKAQAEDAFEGFVEDMYYHVDNCGDWEMVDNDTPVTKLPLLINHESEVVKILANQRLAGNSVYGPEVQHKLQKLLVDNVDHAGRYDYGYKQGRFYTIAKLYEKIGEKKLAILWKSWAYFDPYD